MSLTESARAVAPERAWRGRLLRGFAVVSAAALTAACTTTAAPMVGVDPSHPDARVRPVGYQSILGSYSSQRPVSPSDWRDQNERVAPRSGQ